ncbi:hypothetical protein VN12_22950 [Pirellula sp. SH-Sr6A]|uniref:hypothetical protein n=1 Tax=Pirellula sp. SH-Sr6A TaxID=1632865 RepID=UPI00078EB9FB|nr:hypothetical protein [Pirellula sp. SH-Sr6A]AMV35003.1 hypothetical protein VN12_22950 [Pirellula sp. SH-Sr6A]
MKRVVHNTVARVRSVVLSFVMMWLVTEAQRAWGQVAFDVNPVVAAREVGQLGIMGQMPNSRMVEVQLDVSALFTPGDSSRVTEFTVKMVSRHEDVQVADYSPRTELQSEILGPMQITQDSDRVREAAIRGMGGYPGAGTIQGYAYGHDNAHETVIYAKKPAMELSTASGTLDRRRGVYFKVKQSSQSTLEGARPFRIVFEVPSSWRADLLDVTIEAVGLDTPASKRPRVLSVQQFVVAMYQEYDEHAAGAATQYARQQQRLASYARMYASAIEQKSFPTPLHKLGAKLDIYEPNIPQNWYETLVYRSGTNHNMFKLSHLPVDLRVAILNYLDQKSLLEAMSGCCQEIPQMATAAGFNMVNR